MKIYSDMHFKFVVSYTLVEDEFLTKSVWSVSLNRVKLVDAFLRIPNIHNLLHIKSKNTIYFIVKAKVWCQICILDIMKIILNHLKLYKSYFVLLGPQLDLVLVVRIVYCIFCL